jgi:hypothetical protein
MPARKRSLRIGDAAGGGRLDGGAGVGDELLDVRVVRLGLAFAHDRHRRPVQDGVPGGEEEEG